MSPVHRGLVVAAVHVGLVLTLGAKLLYDRATCPRVWARTVPVDPKMFIRGRYVRLDLEVEPRGIRFYSESAWERARLVAQDGKLIATPATGDTGVWVRRLLNGTVIVARPSAFFIPDGVPDPAIRREGEQLWAEVTIPRRGPPRPLRLGVKRGAGPVEPLEF